MKAVTEAKARQYTRVERDKTKESRAMYAVLLPAGWCYEPGRHCYILPTKAEAVAAKEHEPIEPCEPNCYCQDEDLPHEEP